MDEMDVLKLSAVQNSNISDWQLASQLAVSLPVDSSLIQKFNSN